MLALWEEAPPICPIKYEHLHPETHFYFPGKYFANKPDQIVYSFQIPTLTVLRQDTYSLLFPLLFDHVGQNLSAGLPLSVQQVCRHGSLWCFIIILLLGISLFMHFDTVKIQEILIHINIGLRGYNYNHLSLNVLTFSSSESFQHVFVCGTIWPSIRSASWLCETFREPHGSPSSFSFHDGQGDNRAACDATRCARSEATKEKAYMHTSTTCHSAEYYTSTVLLLWRIHGNFYSHRVHANSQFNNLRKQQFNPKVSHVM